MRTPVSMLAHLGSLQPAGSSKGAVSFGCSPMEHPRGPRKPLSGRRARSLDTSLNPRKDSESWGCQCPSLPTTLSRQALPRSTSDGNKHPKSPRASEDPGTTGTALGQEGTRELLPSDQRPLKDAKKDKAQTQAQQGLLKTVMNFFLRTGPEETREKASRRAKGKEGLPQPAETSESPGEPAPQKKAHDKKASRKKHHHKKHVDEQTNGVQGQEVESQEAALPKTAAVSFSEEADQGPGRRGEEIVPVSMVTALPHPQGLVCSKLAPQTSQKRGPGR